MNPGKITCDVLKKIRSEIAAANQIEYQSEPCSFKGACTGTCPKCESELQYLEHQLIKKHGSQKTALLAGVSLAIMSGFSSCKPNDAQRPNNQTVPQKPQTETLKNDVPKSDTNQVVSSKSRERENQKINKPIETLQLVSWDTNKVLLSQPIDTTIYLADTLKLNQIEYAKYVNYKSIGPMVGALLPMPIYLHNVPFIYHPFYNPNHKSFPNYSSAPEYFQQGINLESYINQQFKFPNESKVEKKIIKLQILIDEIGRIKDVSVLKSLDMDIDQQIMKIIKNMPNWSPGEDPNGRPTDTRVKITLKVTPEKVKVVRQTYDEVEITMDNK